MRPTQKTTSPLTSLKVNILLTTVYEAIRNIKDPEHPYTLEELRVVELEKIRVDDLGSRVDIEFTPTIPHCSLATLIGLTIKVKLIRSLPSRMKVSVRVCKNTHKNEHDINKQLNDKERVAAAIENKHLLNLVNQGVYNAHSIEQIFKEFN